MTTKIKVTNFDFDTIKLDFKSYLKSQPEFTDYNFEGSNLNVLLDILAYNTHYHALMANMLANEMFLDTAVKRSSVISHAKSLGYIPKSKTASKAFVNINLSYTSNIETNSYVLKKGVQVLKTNIDGRTLTFTTINNYASSIIRDVSNPNNYSMSFPNVEIYEGEYTTTTEVYDVLSKMISIKNLDIDLSTLTVSIRDQQKEIYENYVYANSLLNIDSNSKVYFIQEGFDGRYQIYFGDGVFGAQPADNSVVTMSYIVTHGAAGNGASSWILSNPDSTIMLSNYAHADIIGSSASGSNRESIESIKFNSSNHFGTQNRAVVASDYSAIAQQYSDSIKTVIAWGGEDEIPPIYNSVVLCAIPNHGDDLTSIDKVNISNYLKTKAVGTTNIVFKAPDYLDLNLDITFTYNPKLINLSIYEVESAVKDTVGSYARNYLYNFSGSFKESKFLTMLDRVNGAITGTTLNLVLSKNLLIRPYVNTSYVLEFSNQLDTSLSSYSVYSSGFYISSNSDLCYIVDDRLGNLNIISDKTGGVVKSNIGKVDYVTGKVNIELSVTHFVGTQFKIIARPNTNNITSSRNNILRIKAENINVISKGE